MRALYVTHPQVAIDPLVPVPLWGLSLKGRARAEAFYRRGVVPAEAMVFTSAERKAVEMADIFTAERDGLVTADHDMGENDRSATGFLPPDLFEATADRFFAEPEQSVDGWERAVDAQARIVKAVAIALVTVPPGRPAVFCGHGAVGTLLKCFVGKRGIARSEDQSRGGNPGGGNCFVFDLRGEVLHSDWIEMEALEAGWERE